MGILINYIDELEPYFDRFSTYKLTNEKLISCSPFREDSHPSFAVNLETGVWIDSGSFDPDYRKGNFTKLIAMLNNWSYDEAHHYLHNKYNLMTDTDDLRLNINLPVDKEREVLTVYESDNLTYLLTRGIDIATQLLFNIGFCPESNAVIIPIFNKEDYIVALKFRSTTNKKFWFKGNNPRQYLFGYNIFKVQTSKVLYVFESEIDALTAWSSGIPAVATMGSSITKEQVNLILLLDIEEIVCCGDNDGAGEVFNKQLEFKFSGVFKLSQLIYPEGIKDINEVDIVDRLRVLHNLKTVPPFKEGVYSS